MPLNCMLKNGKKWEILCYVYITKTHKIIMEYFFKTVDFYTLNRWNIWYVNFILIKLLKKNKQTQIGNYYKWR